MNQFLLVESLLYESMSETTAAANSVQDTHAALQQALQLVRDGAWQGQGADMFIAEVTTRLLPELTNLVAAIQAANQTLYYSLQQGQAADAVCRQAVQQLDDLYRDVF